MAASEASSRHAVVVAVRASSKTMAALRIIIPARTYSHPRSSSTHAVAVSNSITKMRFKFQYKSPFTWLVVFIVMLIITVIVRILPELTTSEKIVTIFQAPSS